MSDLPTDAVFELASTVQSAHINRHPDPRYDANPSSTLSRRSPVRFRSHLPAAHSSSSTSPPRSASASIETAASDEIPISVLTPPPRNPALPPLPDLRFEQSYLARIRPLSHPADGSPPKYLYIAWYTFFDHLLLPLSQGLLWNLVLHGWRTWNTAARFQGAGVGAKVRRWWWGVNNWTMPMGGLGGGQAMAGANWRSKQVAKEAQEFFENEFGSAGMD